MKAASNTNNPDAEAAPNMLEGNEEMNLQHTQAVNGGIDDDDLLEMMAREASTMNPSASDNQISTGPYGSNKKQC